VPGWPMGTERRSGARARSRPVLSAHGRAGQRVPKRIRWWAVELSPGSEILEGEVRIGEAGNLAVLKREERNVDDGRLGLVANGQGAAHSARMDASP